MRKSIVAKNIIALCVIGILFGIILVPIVNTNNINASSTTKPKNTVQKSNNGNTLYVGGSGPSNYTKIQDAINDANDRDTLIVYSSIYEENIVVYKSLSIIGMNYLTIDWINESEDTITIVSPNCVIQGFKISGGWSGMKILHGSMGNEIKNNIFERNDYSGLYLDRVYETVVSQNIFQNNYYCGIYLRGCDRVLISGNNFSSTGHGIHGSIITNCEIMNNNFFNGGHAIMISPKSFDCVICNNEIKSYYTGIVNEGPNSIYYNNIVSNIEGIFCLGNWETKGQIFENNITNNKHGISLMNIWLGNLEIRRNNFIGNKMHAEFVDAYFILWYENYWDGWKVPLPKSIFGLNGWGFIPWFQFDWHPLLEPYEWWANG